MPEIPPDQGAQPELFNYLQGFLKSTVEGIPELIGLDPSQETQQWRNDNPVGGFVSEFATPVGYYAGALKLGRLGRFGSAVERLGQSYGPFLGGAMREGARIAPFELGRVTLSALMGDPEKTALDALIGTATSAGIGAFGGALEAAGRRVAAKWGSADPRAPIQVQARTLIDKLPDLKGDTLALAQRQLRDWSFQIRQGQQPTGAAIQKPIAAGGAYPEAIARLNRLFKFGSGQKFSSQPLARTSKGLQTDAEIADATGRAGMPQNWEFYTQFPRLVTLFGKEGRRVEKGAISAGMQQVSEDTWIAKERNGLYLMARRLKPGVPAPGKQIPHSQWMLFKTDDPTKFASIGEQAWATKVEGWSEWLSTAEQKTQGLVDQLPTVGFTKKFMGELPFRDGLPVGPGAVGRAINQAGKMYGYGDAGELAEGFKRHALEYWAPAAHKFRDNPLAQWLSTNMKATFDYANSRLAKIMLGTKELAPGSSLIKPIAIGQAIRGGLRDTIEKLEPQDLHDIWKLWVQGLGPESPDFAQMTQKAQDLFRQLDSTNKEITTEMLATETALGLPKTKFLANHLGISHTWEGSYRVPVMEGRKIVFIGAGKDRATAIGRAEEVAAQAKLDGKGWFVDKPFMNEPGDDIALLRRMSKDPDTLQAAGGYAVKLNSMPQPSFFKPRKGIGGYQFQSAPFTKDQLLEGLSGHYQTMLRYLARKSSEFNLEKGMKELADQDPKMAKQVGEYLDDLSGIQGPFSRMVNKFADSALAPFMGKNSATSLVRGFNKAFYIGQLAAGNLAFPFMTLLTFAQTVLPELAFVAHGAPERVQRYYYHALAGDAAGRPAKVLGVMDAFKMQWQAVKAMKAPPPDLTAFVNQAAEEGILDPRLLEEYIGPSARAGLTLREALKSGGVVKWLDKVSNFLPESTERLSRLHAFTGAYLFGRDFLGLQDARLYNFSKTFTNRTMYLYHTADRPKILQGPLGSAFGLFKNWQMNFLWNQMDYLGEASAGNFKPMLWGFTGSSLIGGLPAGGLGYWAADRFSQWSTHQTIMERLYGAYPRDPDGENASDALFLGLPAFLPTLAGLPGVSLSQQAAVPLSDPVRDISQLMSLVYWDRLKHIGAAAGQAVAAWDAGENPFKDKRFTGELARTFAPKSLYRLQQTLADGVLTSSATGEPQINATPAEKALYVLGFNPSNTELAYRAHEVALDAQLSNEAKISAIANLWAQAQAAGDYDQVQRLLTQVTIQGIDPDSVMRAVRSRSKNAQQDMFERTIDKKRLYQLRQAGLYQG